MSRVAIARGGEINSRPDGCSADLRHTARDKVEAAYTRPKTNARRRRFIFVVEDEDAVAVGRRSASSRMSARSPVATLSLTEHGPGKAASMISTCI